jgi:hypothetical protein
MWGFSHSFMMIPFHGGGFRVALSNSSKGRFSSLCENTRSERKLVNDPMTLPFRTAPSLAKFFEKGVALVVGAMAFIVSLLCAQGGQAH